MTEEKQSATELMDAAKEHRKLAAALDRKARTTALSEIKKMIKFHQIRSDELNDFLRPAKEKKS